MKHSVKILMLVIFSLSLFVGCSKNEPVKVGLLIHALDNERWENDRDYFVEKVNELGGTVEVRVADNNSDKQLEQANDLLAKGVQVLVVIPVDQFDAAQIVFNAQEKGVGVISYDRLIKNCNLDYYVSTDNVEIGKLQAEYLTSIKPTGKYALIGGAMSDNNSQFLYLGQMNVLQPLVDKGDIEIVYNAFTDHWGKDEGYEHANKMLEITDDVDAVIAGNDAIAMGVNEALKEAGKEGEVLVAGMDADLHNLHEIIAGNQTCTVYKPYEKMAATAAELAVTLGKTGDCKSSFQTVSNGNRLVPAVLHEGIVVNKENLKLTVISEGYQTEEEVYR